MSKIERAVGFLVAFGWFFFGFVVAFILANWLPTVV